MTSIRIDTIGLSAYAGRQNLELPLPDDAPP